jgi:hypothetical protein
MKLSLKKLNDILHGLVTKLHGFITKLHGFITKRGRTMRLIVAILAVALLCVILSGLTLTQLTSDYQPSGTNDQPSGTNEVTDPDAVEPNYPTTKTISTVGSLKTIGIGAYWDENLIDKVKWIDWGKIEPGAQNNVVIYFHNEGNSAVTLSQSTSNWSPSVASNYLTLSWNYNGQKIEEDEKLQVTLTLSVSANIAGVTDFDFDIIVVGTG